MIISGGVNIYPQEIEDALILHPKIMDVAVIGVPNEEMGEEVKAVVQLMESVTGSAAVAEELVEYARAAPCPLQVPAEYRLRRRTAAPAHRQTLQGRLEGAVLAGGR